MRAYTYPIVHISAETEPKLNTEPKTCTNWIFFFFSFGGLISGNTTGNFIYTCTYKTTCIVYNLVIIEAIDGLPSETIARLFYKHNTTDFRMFWDKTQSNYKECELKSVTWNNFNKSVDLQGLSQIIHVFSKVVV